MDKTSFSNSSSCSIKLSSPSKSEISSWFNKDSSNPLVLSKDIAFFLIASSFSTLSLSISLVSVFLILSGDTDLSDESSISSLF